MAPFLFVHYFVPLQNFFHRQGEFAFYGFFHEFFHFSALGGAKFAAVAYRVILVRMQFGHALVACFFSGSYRYQYRVFVWSHSFPPKAELQL